MIINSLLDTDLYKLTMMQAALHQFPTVDVKYEFKCRNKASFSEAMFEDIVTEIDHYCTLHFTGEELDYLSGIQFFQKDFIVFLRLYKSNRDYITAYLDCDYQLHITVRGPWYLTILFEVPILAIVNEVYFKHLSGKKIRDELIHAESGYERLEAKYNTAKDVGFLFADFGTRRRNSHLWQEDCIKEMQALPNFLGTSNVYFAKKYDIKPIGTMAHEFIMVGQGLENVTLRNSQKAMLQAWVDEYRGDLGIALTDTIGIDAFLRDFDLYFAKLYDGLRHDSGDPYDWADKVIKHYEKLGIDPCTKKLVFSDGLDFNMAASLFITFRDSAQISFGIGTNLTNDFKDVIPLQIVMKIVECNGKPVAKISDSPGKSMCHDGYYLDYLKSVFQR